MMRLDAGHSGLKTLRQRLLQHVLTPLFLVWCIGTAVTVSIAYNFTLQAFDRALLDDAYALSAHVRLQNGEPTLELSSRELASVLFDQSERVYFAVQRTDGTLLAGHAGLFDAARDRTVADAAIKVNEAAATFTLSDRAHQGLAVRAVTLPATVTKPWTIVVAQTTGSRTRLIERLLLWAVVPQAILLVALAAWLLRAIGHDLEPLNRLRLALQQRGTSDLSAIPTSGDTRDVAQLTEATNALMQRVDLGIQGQREFTGNVAHELRNPLAGIRALAEYGLRQNDPTVLREQLNAIAKSETRASHLIDQLLALALADEAREQLALVPVSINEIVEDSVADLLSRSGDMHVELSVSGLDQPVTALGNATLLKGCIANFLDNAVAYGKPGHPGKPGTPSNGQSLHIAIRVAPSAETGQILLSVADNGPGLTQEQAARLQQRWARGQGSERLQGGAGLGLAIVARYAELLGAVFTLSTDGDSGGLCATLALQTPAVGSIKSG